MSSSNEYTESVGEYSTLKTAVGGAQPSRIKTEDAGDSDELASSIAKRKAGDPNAYERVPVSDNTGGAGRRKGRGKGDSEDGGKHGLGKFKVPLIVSGVALAIVGALVALSKQSKDAELERDL